MPANTSSDEWLRAVRVLMATAVAVVILPAVDMPGGYMGARDTVTTTGAVYTGAALLAAMVAVASVLQGREWGQHLSSILLSVNVGIFTPGLASDPVLTGLVVTWQLVALGFHLAPRRSSRVRGRVRRDRTRREGLEEWYQRWGSPVQHSLMTAVILAIAVVGFGVSGRPSAILTCAAINVLALVGAYGFLREAVRGGNWLVAIVLVPWLVLWVSGPSLSGLLAALAASNGVIFVGMLGGSPLFEEVVEYFFESPALLVVTSFASVILFGTLLLVLPAASPGPEAISPVDALFTSTSATCVTGLIVLDTPHDFTFFGQSVILALIQVGGLGIMVVSTFGAILVGEELGLSGERALGDLMEIGGIRDAYRLTRFIVLTTLAFEAVGAASLTAGYLRHGHAPAEAVWHGIFHAVSAFCNAGFALQSDSIVMFQQDPLMLGVFAALIVFGGVGFVVLAGVWTWLTGTERSRFDVQSKAILVMTVSLLGLGTLLYAACEWNASLGGLPVADKLTNAIFQSVTLRTAGFNSVGFEALNPASALFMMAFMFIGASPGSTAGGIKTTTVAVLLGAVRAIARGETNVVLFERRVSQSVVYRAASIAFVAGFVLVSGTFVLLTVEEIPFQTTLFEAVSALGTVGLSLGATDQLRASGKLTVVAMMYLGRLGPLTLALILGETDSSDLSYPTEDVMVG